MNKLHVNYKVGDTVMLKDNWLSTHTRSAVILKDYGDGWFVVRVDTAYPWDYCADGTELLYNSTLFV